MQLAIPPQRTDLRFREPVRNLLKQKGGTVWSIPPDATVYQAIEKMSEKHIGALLVMQGGFLMGIVSERDYARKVILKGRNSHETKVREIMASPVLFATPSQTLDDCMQLMANHRLRHVPVVEGENVVGVLSMGDIVSSIVQAQQQTIDHLRQYIDGTYPG
jgi:signal-transduction protein with cAMP-binding, CBS, and nucleotidyltransferase domain